MYICECCKKEFDSEEKITKHCLICWREQHPYHKSKPAPQSASVTVREVSEDIQNFFESFGKGKV